MSKRSRSKPGIVGPSTVGESFASLVKQDADELEDGGGESFASLIKKSRPKTKNDGKKKRPRTGSGATRRKRAASKVGKAQAEPAPRQPAPAPVPVPRRDTTVVVFENGASNQKRVVDVANTLGYRAEDTRRDEGTLVAVLSRESPPELLIVGMPGGEHIIAEATKHSPQTLVVASMPGPAESARDRATQVGADLFVVRPHTKDSLAVVLLAGEKLGSARRELSAQNGVSPAAASPVERVGAETGFQHFEFFERVLIMEIKRAKRFGYSLATALVGFDDPSGGPHPAAVETELRVKVAKAIRANIRDIDVPVDYADGRILLFLPYTDLDGANQVGRRVVAAVRQFGHTEIDGQARSCSVSIGISAVRPGDPISFARLMKDAKQALRAAQLKGGDQVIVRK